MMNDGGGEDQKELVEMKDIAQIKNSMKGCKNMPKQDGTQGVSGRGGKVQGGKEHSHYKCFNIQINMSQKKPKKRREEIIQESEHFP